MLQIYLLAHSSIYTSFNIKFKYLVRCIRCLTNAFTNTIQSGFYTSVTGWNVSSGYQLIQNKWTNIQVTWDGKKIKVYINGELYSTTEKSATAIDSGRLYFISHKWDNSDHMIGEIGEIRIYNYPLSESEIISDYQSSVDTFPNP